MYVNRQALFVCLVLTILADYELSAYVISNPLVIDESRITGKQEASTFIATLPLRNRTSAEIQASLKCAIVDLDGKSYGETSRQITVLPDAVSETPIAIVLTSALPENAGFYVLKYTCTTKAKTIEGVRSLLPLMNSGSAYDAAAAEFVSKFQSRFSSRWNLYSEAIRKYHDRYKKDPQDARELVEKHLLSEQDALDPWGQRFEIQNSAIVSPGPDEIRGTSDDLKY